MDEEKEWIQFLVQRNCEALMQEGYWENEDFLGQGKSEASEVLTKVFIDSGSDLEVFAEKTAELLMGYKEKHLISHEKTLEHKRKKREYMKMIGQIYKFVHEQSSVSLKVSGLEGAESIFVRFKEEKFELKLKEQLKKKFFLAGGLNFELGVEEGVFKVSVAEIVDEKWKDLDKEHLEQVVEVTGVEFKVKVRVWVRLALKDKLVYLQEKIEERSQMAVDQEKESLLFRQVSEVLKLRYCNKDGKFKSTWKDRESRGGCCQVCVGF